MIKSSQAKKSVTDYIELFSRKKKKRTITQVKQKKNEVNHTVTQVRQNETKVCYVKVPIHTLNWVILLLMNPLASTQTQGLMHR